jgi:hypothetical protein
MRKARKIALLWATVRPEMCAGGIAYWLSKANKPQHISVKVACSFPQHKEAFHAAIQKACANAFPLEVILAVYDRPGATRPFYELTKPLEMDHDDIVVIASDDFKPPDFWDAWASHHFDDFDGSLLPNDGYQTGKCTTLPIMTFGCLCRLNKITYHPAYFHAYSDSELYDVLQEMGLLRDLRIPSQPVFEHVHWAASKRSPDEWDDRVKRLFFQDQALYEKRKNLPLAEKLRVC